MASPDLEAEPNVGSVLQETCEYECGYWHPTGEVVAVPQPSGPFKDRTAFRRAGKEAAEHHWLVYSSFPWGCGQGARTAGV